MPATRQNTSFLIDGYEISATFAETGDPAAIGRVKQILLSSFVANSTGSPSKGILDDPAEERDNSSGGSPHVP